MTTYYVDPEGGNDANAGTSFANRRKTIAAITTANLAPGDTIRVIASRDPGSTGINGTWTNGNRAVTLATAMNLTVDNCTAAWTASANVTCSANTTIARKFDGASISAASVAGAFTTGKIAYRTLPSALDLSAYEQISLWVMSSNGMAANGLELRLCTDTTGDVVAHTINLCEQALTFGGWRVVQKDFAGALNSSIQSISLFANSDPGASTNIFYLQNIIACKTRFGAATLTHLSLIKPAAGTEWYPISYIDGTTVGLGMAGTLDWTSANVLVSGPRPYGGATVTSALHKLDPLDGVNGGGTAYPFSAASRALQDNGSLAGGDVVVSGGWDRSAMSSQSGESWLTGSHFASNGFDLGNSNFAQLTNFGFAHFTSSPCNIGSGSGSLTIDLLGSVGCANAFSANSTTGFLDMDIGYVLQCAGGNTISISGLDSCDWTLDIDKIIDCPGSTGAGLIAVGTGLSHTGRARVPIIDNCGPVPVSLSSNLGNFVLSDCVMTNGQAGTTMMVNGSNAGHSALLLNCSPANVPAATLITSDASRRQAQNDGQVAGVHWRQGYYYALTSQQATRHTASGWAWKLAVGHATFVHVRRPVEVPIGRIYLAAGVATTIKCWMQRSSTSLNCGIRLKGGCAPGITTDTSGAMTAAINTWEEVSLTVTATIDGAVEIQGYAYGAVADCFFDDLSATI